MSNTRRQFLQGLATAAVVSPLASVTSFGLQRGQTAAAPGRGGANAAFDVVIKGGTVIDPSRRLNMVMDVAIKGDTIAAVAPNIPTSEARTVFEAGGKIVTAGLVDSHGHVYDGGIATSIDPDTVGINKGVTTIVDAGSAGAANFAGFRKYIIERSRTRVFALLNIGMNGCCNNELYGDQRLVNPQAAITTIEQNRPFILGVKVRINGKHDELAHDSEVMKKARQVADATGLPIMMHWSNEPELHALLKAGDVITHPYNPPSPNSSNLMGGEPGKILQQALALKERGVWTDFAHGSHLSWAIAEESAKQGWFPDLISTDIHRGHVPPNGVVYDLPTTISKFLYLGMTIDQAVAAVTSTPARVFRFPGMAGSLEPGTKADITISELRRGDFDIADSRRVKRVGHQKFVPTATIKDGTFVYWEP